MFSLSFTYILYFIYLFNNIDILRKTFAHMINCTFIYFYLKKKKKKTKAS